MSAQSYQVRTEYFIPLLPFTHGAQGHTVRRSLITVQTVSGPDSLGDVIFSDVARGTEPCPLVLFKSCMWPTETVCPFMQLEGTEGLNCDRRRAVHCPSALPWVVILNVNCYKLWAITSRFMDLLSTACIAHWPQGGFIVHHHDVVTFLQVRIAAYRFFQQHRGFMTQLAL